MDDYEEDDDEEEDASRREEELEALRAFYGEEGVELTAAAGAAGAEKNDRKGDQPPPPTTTLRWRVRVGTRAWLNLDLPVDYPSRSPPVPSLDAPALGQTRTDVLLAELLELWTAAPDQEIVLVWAEHCRTVLQQDDEEADEEAAGGDDYCENGEALDDTGKEERGGGGGGGGPFITKGTENDDASNNNLQQHRQQDDDDDDDDGALVVTFVPSSSRFGQPVRQFRSAAVSDPANACAIFHGEPFRPPRSGASERMVAHVARVSSQHHVDWVWAELLMEDKKVAKASHNMVAYRYIMYSDASRNGNGSPPVLVSDNDDDGEKGAGTKLASLLELMDARDVMVVVSRWFGGVKLGPSRFKWIAHVARDALDRSGYLVQLEDGDGDGDDDAGGATAAAKGGGGGTGASGKRNSKGRSSNAKSKA